VPSARDHDANTRMPMSLQRYFDVSQAQDAQTLRTRLVEHTHELGFAFVAAVMVHEDAGSGEGPLIVALGNAPEDYETTEALSVEDSLRDPVLRRLRHMSVPFAWDQDTYTREGAGDLWERQAAHGFRTGVAVALHLDGGRHFLLGVDRDQALPEDPGRLTRMMSELQLLAVHSQDAAQRLLGPPAPTVDKPPTLDARELEVLRWVMNGHSAWAVGRMLAISEAAVQRHLREAARKLGTRDGHGSVLRALSLGLIH